MFYEFITHFRNFFYEIGVFKINQLPCKVISIGNLTVGGTGKTPTVIYMAKLLKNKGYRIGIISRGYKRTTKGTILVSDGIKTFHKWHEVGDEPFMMATKLKNIPIAVDSNRYRAGLLLLKKFNTDIILMDDGFQHRKLYRDIDILLINGGESSNMYKPLPQGLLRESWSSISRADIIITTKKKPDIVLSNKITDTLLPVFDTKINYSIIKKRSIGISLQLKNKNVFLYSGIADPKSFISAITKMNCNICGSKFFPDHFSYSEKDIKEIELLAKVNNADAIITTEKDWVKTKKYNPRFKFWVIKLSLEIIEEKKFYKTLLSFNI